MSRGRPTLTETKRAITCPFTWREQRRAAALSTSERVREAGHPVEDNDACLMMRVMSTIRHQSALCGTSNTVNDRIELGRQAVLIVGSLDREHGAGDQRQPIDN